MSIDRKPLLGELLNYSDPLTKGLVGLWLMNEGLGNKVYDLSGNGNTGTITGAGWVNGKFGSALDFDGSGEYVLCGDAGIGGTSSATLSFWLNKDFSGAAGTEFIAGIQDSGEAARYTFCIAHYPLPAANTEFKVFVQGNGGQWGYYYPESLFADNTWIHIAVVWSTSQNILLYRNGSLLTASGISVDGSGTLRAGGNFSIARDEGDASRDGDQLLDLPLLYNRALAAGEIAQLYREPFCFISQRRRRRRLLFPSVAAAFGVAVRRKAYRPVTQKPLLGEQLDYGNPLTKNPCLANNWIMAIR
jgi:hypothetical protein